MDDDDTRRRPVPRGLWRRLATRRLFSSPWFSVRRDEVALPSGKTVPYHLIEQPGWVLVVPLLDDGRVVMERIYRYTIDGTLLECPSGGLDGEAPEVAARRELEEETGYLAEHLEPLGSFYASSGISNERFHVYLARGLSASGTVAQEETEEIVVELVPLAELYDLARRGELVDGPSALAILMVGERELRSG